MLKFSLPLVVVGLLLTEISVAGAASRPNILLIYADDLGYGDVACNNPDRGRIKTPHIDALAAEGMRFTDAHSSSGVCSPSRYTLLTGRYHWRTRLQKGIVGVWGQPLIAPDRLTIASLLKQNGYTTACIGKWHLGWDWPIRPAQQPHFSAKNSQASAPSAEQLTAWQQVFSQRIAGGPTSRGFDRYFGTDVPNWPPFCFIDQDRTVGIPSAFLRPEQLQNNQASVAGPALPEWKLKPILPALGDQVIRFMELATAEQQPFFVYMPLTTPHTPLAVNDPWLGKSGLNQFADLVMETDAVVGRVIDAVKHMGVAENTLIVFTSDNGCAPYIGVEELETKGHFPSGPLRGYKSDAWEGGHRVPFIVRWPGRVRPGTVCPQLIHQADLLATIAKIVDVPLPANAGEDSFDIGPLLNGSEQPIRQHAVSQSSGGLIAIRDGHWKMIFGPGSGGWGKGNDAQAAQLYDLAQDIAESNNLYNDQPNQALKMTEMMEQLVHDGRSTPGPKQANDQPFNWRQFMKMASKP